MNRALQGSIWEFGNVMVLQVGSLFTKAVACGLSISCPLERDNVIYVPNKVSGPHIEKIFSGSSKRLKLLVYHPRPPPSHPPPPPIHSRQMLIHHPSPCFLSSLSLLVPSWGYVFRPPLPLPENLLDGRNMENGRDLWL